LDGVLKRAVTTHCYDLVNHHAPDIQDDWLAFGTTTGNVYLSDDRGAA
jgi:hypothetical protein